MWQLVSVDSGVSLIVDNNMLADKFALRFQYISISRKSRHTKLWERHNGTLQSARHTGALTYSLQPHPFLGWYVIPLARLDMAYM